jgi:endonuclease-3
MPPKNHAARTKTKPAPAAPPEAYLKPAARRPRPSAAKIREAERIRLIFERFAAVEPHPKGELAHVNAYTLLVAVVMSAQATDAGVNKATKPLFARVDTPQKMVDLGEPALREAIKTIGLFRAKAKNVIELSRRLVAEFDSAVPEDRAALESLPGVGRKTANVVLNMAFGHPTLAVDTHVFRVSNRIPIARGKTPLEVEFGLEWAIPDDFKLHAHHWLILHGRYVCKARRPECKRCVIADLCRSPEKRVAA